MQRNIGWREFHLMSFEYIRSKWNEIWCMNSLSRWIWTHYPFHCKFNMKNVRYWKIDFGIRKLIWLAGRNHWSMRCNKNIGYEFFFNVKIAISIFTRQFSVLTVLFFAAFVFISEKISFRAHFFECLFSGSHICCRFNLYTFSTFRFLVLFSHVHLISRLRFFLLICWKCFHRLNRNEMSIGDRTRSRRNRKRF